MKTLYFECNMGAAGDMLMAALLELHNNPEDFVNRFNYLGIPGVTLTKEEITKCGIKGTHMHAYINGEEEHSHDVNEHNFDEHIHKENSQHVRDCIHEENAQYIYEHTHEEKEEHSHGEHHHAHSSMADVKNIISKLNINEKVKNDVLAVYNLIAMAESNAHGMPVEQIHFHEVGSMDAIADVVGVCMLMDEISPDTIITSPINVGKGMVKCAHGILPVPAPATAFILKDVPIYSGPINGEMCTPTGAALLKYFTDEFATMPVLNVEKIGYGMGSKDFPVANCVRAFLSKDEKKMDDVVELVCNLDDMTPESIAFATELMINQGALDVYTTNIYMKKNRPGIMLTCMCKKQDKEKFLEIIFKHTTTLGIREYICNRYGLERKVETLNTKFGDVRIKTSTGYNTTKSKLEYDDIAKFANKNNMSLNEIKNIIEKGE